MCGVCSVSVPSPSLPSLHSPSPPLLSLLWSLHPRLPFFFLLHNNASLSFLVWSFPFFFFIPWPSRRVPSPSTPPSPYRPLFLSRHPPSTFPFPPQPRQCLQEVADHPFPALLIRHLPPVFLRPQPFITLVPLHVSLTITWSCYYYLPAFSFGPLFSCSCHLTTHVTFQLTSCRQYKFDRFPVAFSTLRLFCCCISFFLTLTFSSSLHRALTTTFSINLFHHLSSF